MADDTVLRRGATAYDSERQCYAGVREIETSRIALRRISGGEEWWAQRSEVRAATTGEVLSARLRDAGTSTHIREVM